ncbi:hypothetical protein [Dongia sp.]|uniref:hypothetical protein n=1 Tax=Dongia sp. TaxID=1977262 RepID=UPI0035B16782
MSDLLIQNKNLVASGEVMPKLPSLTGGMPIFWANRALRVYFSRELGFEGLNAAAAYPIDQNNFRSFRMWHFLMSVLDWATTGVVAWLLEKCRRVAWFIVRTAYFFYRASQRQRLYVSMQCYAAIQDTVLHLIEAGVLRGKILRWVQRQDLRATRKIHGWADRVIDRHSRIIDSA